ncbi:MAG: hypothetical protein NTV82_03675 [Candidatus Aminicenantes bacterium]|jgi:gamma-glutamyltranspeptidase|nr:hypothetical protein [Candidatus Aminicenantes bacterium]
MMTMNKRSIFFLSVQLIGFSRLPLFSQALIPKEAKNGTAVSTQGLATEAGLEILKKSHGSIF